ncbi:MAG: hypothetical protein DHS20C20_17280 [Ardenticatenaceae bacterium]|nr:MAG: hypothetical protein DHS20C20_17280 [Ardenticatenaceae bacterium]
MAVGTPLPLEGIVLITVYDYDKSTELKNARDLYRLGFELYATEGTAVTQQNAKLPVTMGTKEGEPGLNTAQLISSGAVQRRE